jgi:hypothetical protein
MATIAVARDAPISLRHEVLAFLWEAMGDADTGEAIEVANFADRSIQVAGTFGSATLTVQGSNDGSNWATLNDPQGNALTVTSAKVEQILELTRYLRVTTSGGSGTDLDVTLVCRRTS